MAFCRVEPEEFMVQPMDGMTCAVKNAVIRVVIGADRDPCVLCLFVVDPDLRR